MLVIILDFFQKEVSSKIKSILKAVILHCEFRRTISSDENESDERDAIDYSTDVLAKFLKAYGFYWNLFFIIIAC